MYYKPLVCLGRGSLGLPKDAGVGALPLQALLSVFPCSMVRSGCWMGLSALCSPMASVLSSSSEEEKSWDKRRVEKLRPVSVPSGCRTPNCEGSSSQKQGANDQRTFSHLLCCPPSVAKQEGAQVLTPSAKHSLSTPPCPHPWLCRQRGAPMTAPAARKLSRSCQGGSLRSNHLRNSRPEKWVEDWGPDRCGASGRRCLS